MSKEANSPPTLGNLTPCALSGSTGTFSTDQARRSTQWCEECQGLKVRNEPRTSRRFRAKISFQRDSIGRLVPLAAPSRKKWGRVSGQPPENPLMQKSKSP